MSADIVVDASVLAKFFFHEPDSALARAALTDGAVVAAPSLILIELASIAVKKVRLGEATLEQAREAVAAVGDLVDEIAPLDGLAGRSFQLSLDTGCSV